MSTHKPSKALIQHLFGELLRFGRPTLAQIAEDAELSPSLIDKIRWGQRRPTKKAIDSFTLGIEERGYFLAHYAKLLRAAAETGATDYTNLDCRQDGVVVLMSLNAQEILLRPGDEIQDRHYTEFFRGAPKELRPASREHVTLLHEEHDDEAATLVITPFSPDGEHWQVAVLIRDPEGPRTEPSSGWMRF